MSMLGAGELCRAILEDAEVARAFEFDTDGRNDLMSTYLHAMEDSEMASARLRIVSLQGHGLSASQSVSTLGVGGSLAFA